MFSATNLLVLACAYAAAVNAQHACSTAEIGRVTNHRVKYQSVPLPPFNLDYIVNIPSADECVYGNVGLHATVCDVDVPPAAFFRDLNTLIVHRKGSALGAGLVSVTAFCDS